ncbi:MAG TPA: WbqC family protein [Balneolales bacterium]|nr:WbqC family protein [Balneolales bacterium]
MSTVTLLTPVLIPDLHDLTMMLRSDYVVINDRDPFSRKAREHRCKIRTPEGTHWLRVPVHPDDRRAPMYKVRMRSGNQWVNDWMRILQLNYRNSMYFDFYEQEMRADLEHATSFPLLIDAAGWIWKRLFRYLYLDTSWTRASELVEYDPDPDIFKQNTNNNLLWQEHDSKSYMRQSNHPDIMPFEHPVYHQHFEGFEPYCCLLDVLFQFGPAAWQLFDRLVDAKD